MMIGGIAAGVAVLAALFFAFGGTGGNNKKTTDPSNTPANKSSEPSKAAAPKLDGGKAKAGKTPDRPAPAIDADKMAKAEKLFEEATAEWNEAQKQRKAGRPKTEWKPNLDRAWDKLEEQRALLEDYSDWYEEADLGDWAIPAEYEALTKRQHVWGKVRQSIHKVKG